MKKLFTIFCIIIGVFLIVTPALAVNTHSIDLESGSSQYLSITDAAQTGLDITGDISVEAWIKRESIGVSMYLISKFGNATGNWRTYALNITSDNFLEFNYNQDGTGGGWTQERADVAITSTDWQHVAATADVSAKTVILYVDGSAVASTQLASNATSIHDNAMAVHIGAADTGSASFDGLMDEVRVWNDIRTAGEISDNYQQEISGGSAGLAGYWQVNNDLLDETANNNDLTNNNSAVFSTDVPFGAAEAIIPDRIQIQFLEG